MPAPGAKSTPPLYVPVARTLPDVSRATPLTRALLFGSAASCDSHVKVKLDPITLTLVRNESLFPVEVSPLFPRAIEPVKIPHTAKFVPAGLTAMLSGWIDPVAPAELRKIVLPLGSSSQKNAAGF